MTKLTPKRERFCLEIVKGKSQSDAYRVAFKPKKMKPKSVNQKASHLMAEVNIRARVQELLAPVVAEAQLTREQWINDGLSLYNADARKLFDKFGNPIPVAELGDDEIKLLEGFKHKTDYLGVKKSEGGEQAVESGYTDDYKITSYKTRHEYMGKAMGFLKEKEGLDLADMIEELVKLSRTDACR